MATSRNAQSGTTILRRAANEGRLNRNYNRSRQVENNNSVIKKIILGVLLFLIVGVGGFLYYDSVIVGAQREISIDLMRYCSEIKYDIYYDVTFDCGGTWSSYAMSVARETITTCHNRFDVFSEFKTCLIDNNVFPGGIGSWMLTPSP